MTTTVPQDPPQAARVSRDVREEIEDFLFDEADLLDRDEFEEWLELLAPNVHYFARVRQTLRRAGGPGFSERSMHLSDNYTSLKMRIQRHRTSSDWAEDPPSRIRHFITNVRVRSGEDGDEYRVTSNALLVRTRADEPKAETVAAERRDIIRRDETGLKLVQREILLDHTTLPTHNLSFWI